MKNKKINILEPLTCNPCDNAIIINSAHNICKISDKIATTSVCNTLHEAVIFEKIDLSKYLNSIKSICTEKQSKEAVTSLLNLIK